MKLDLGLKHFLSMHQYKIAMLLAEPERFIGFRTLEVTFKFNELDCPGADPWTAADKPMMRQSVKERLEPTLGPATEYERDGGQCVGFRPWTFANHRYQQRKTLWTVRDVLGRQRLYTRFCIKDRSTDGGEDGRRSGEEKGEMVEARNEGNSRDMESSNIEERDIYCE